MSGGFFSVSHSEKKSWIRSVLQIPALTPGITEISLRPLARQCSRNSTKRPPLTTCPGSPRRKKRPSRVDPSVNRLHRPCFRGLARRGLGRRGDGSPRFFGRTKISTLVCSVEHTRAVSVGSLFSLSPYFARLVGSFASHHHPPQSPAFSSQWLLSPCAVRFPSRAQETAGHGIFRFAWNSGGQADDASPGIKVPRQSSVPPFLPRRSP